MRLFVICLLNLFPIPLGYLIYSGGAPAQIAFIELCHLILFHVNFHYAKAEKYILLYNSLLLLSTFAFHSINGHLYFSRICDDMLGRAISAGTTIISCLIVIIVTIIQMIVMYIRNRNKNAENIQ